MELLVLVKGGMGFKSWWASRKGVSFLTAQADGAGQFSSASVSLALAGKSDSAANANSIVMASARWAMRNVIEPDLMVFKDDVPMPNHPLSVFLANPQKMLADQPNKDSMDRIIQGLTVSIGILSGNGYIHKLRSDSGKLIGIEYIPHVNVSPVALAGQPSVIDFYNVTLGNGVNRVKPEDMVHITEGYDPNNILLGMSPLHSVIRHILTDNEASVYSHAILRNMGIPPYAVMPDLSKGGTTLSKEQQEQIGQNWQSSSSGESRGKLFISGGPLTVNKLGMSPEELALDKMTRTPEERITAVLLIPAIVAGMGAGLDRSTMANYKEALRAATENFLVPLWSLIATKLEELQPDIGGPWGSGYRLGFDLSKVKALQEDIDAKYTRAAKGYDSGYLTRGDAREIVGLKAEKVDKVYKTDLQMAQAGKLTPTQKANEQEQLAHVPRPS
jgi:HK97 family phage portal protein